MCWTLSSGSISPEYPLPWLPEQVVVRPRLGSLLQYFCRRFGFFELCVSYDAENLKPRS